MYTKRKVFVFETEIWNDEVDDYSLVNAKGYIDTSFEDGSNIKFESIEVDNKTIAHVSQYPFDLELLTDLAYEQSFVDCKI